MKTDITYIDNFHYIAVLPNNEQAEQVVSDVIEFYGSNNIPLAAWDSTRYQMKQAGYSVRKITQAQKNKRDKLTNKELLDILNDYKFGAS